MALPDRPVPKEASVAEALPKEQTTPGPTAAAVADTPAAVALRKPVPRPARVEEALLTQVPIKTILPATMPEMAM